MSDRELHVVVLERRDGTLKPARRAEIVEALTPREAVRVALEGERWETEDGGYTARVAALSDLVELRARRATTVEVTVEERSPA